LIEVEEADKVNDPWLAPVIVNDPLVNVML